MISTIFPHLPQRHGRLFGVLLLSGLALVVALALADLFAAATALACVLLPALYLFYLHEVQVYEHEPAPVVGATFVAGGLLGLLATELLAAPARPLVSGDLQREYLVAGGLPLLGLALMLVGPLLLVRRAHFDEVLDGLTFGAASALGYSLAASLVMLWPIVTGPLNAPGPWLDWSLRLLRQGILFALVNATTTGLVTTSLWLRIHDRQRGRPRAWPWDLPAAALVAVLAQVLLGLLGRIAPDLFLLVVGWTAVTLLLLAYLRLVIHHALLAETAEHEVGAVGACSECHRMVPTMLFCPACGAARSAAPKRLRRAGAA